MKTLRRIATALAAMAVLASCEYFRIDEPELENDTTVPILDGNTLTYGDHQYTLDETATEGTVTFTHFPATKREFQFLQSELLGQSQPGTLALELMAFEVFRRDRAKGKKCVEMCTVSAYAKQVISNLEQKFPERRGDTGDSYWQPYLVASFLAGATQENKYQPEYPYKLSFTYSTNTPNQGEESYTFGGHVYHWVTTRGGNKDYKASVIRLYDGDVLVHGCANFYLAAPPITGNWEDTLK
ncbi:MAG: hypothetical protein J5737_06560 [Bacteroidales bacterium]|nr:hypothetical protein [Bacteroidales bacterium]